VLLLELLEAGEEPRPLATDEGDLGRLEPLSQLRPGGVDDRVREDALCDRSEDGGLGIVGRTATRPTAEGRAADIVDASS
jgi:hypothetical protein